MSQPMSRPMHSLSILAAAAIAAALLPGCASQPALPSVQFAPVHPVTQVRPVNASGSLFVDGRGDNFFGRQRDYAIGDVITVLLDETTSGTRNQGTTVSRDATNTGLTSVQTGLGNSLSASGLPLGFGLGSAAKQIKADAAKTTSAGTGTTNQNASLTGAVAVSVVDVMSNGNLVVRGEKQLSLSEGNEIIQVSGVVRIDDIFPNGTVQSRRLANAQISYRASGDLASSVGLGWGTRALMWLWPF